MIFRWETEEERLKRHMRVPARQKLEWLRKMNDFLAKAAPGPGKRRALRFASGILHEKRNSVPPQ